MEEMGPRENAVRYSGAKVIIQKKYFQVSTFQLFVMACLTGLVAGAVVIINNTAIEYFQLPIVSQQNGSCVSVMNYKNGDAYTCADVNVTLRHYRKTN